MTTLRTRVVTAARRRADIGIDLGWSTGRDLLRIIMAMASFSMLGRRLGTTDYGAYVAFFGIVSSAVALLFRGSNLAILHRLVRERDDAEEVTAAFFTLGAGFVVLGVVASVGLGSLLLDGLTLATMIGFAVAEILGTGIVENAASVVRATTGFPAAVRMTLIYTVSRFLVTVGLFVTDNLDLRNLAIGWAILTILFVVHTFRTTLPAAGARYSFSRPSLQLAKTVTTFALPMFAGELKVSSDKTIMNAYGFRADSGLYGAAYRMLQLALFPLRSVTTAMAHRLLVHDEDRTRQHQRRAFKLSSLNLVTMVPLMVAVYLLAPATTLIVGDEFEDSVDILRWLLLFIPFRSVSGPPVMGLLGLGLVKTRAAIVIGTSALSLLLYVALIPTYSWKGAVVGTVVTEMVLALVAWTTLLIAESRHDSAVPMGSSN